MYGELKGKVVIVTGGTEGIGKAITERFLSEGSKVINFDLSYDGREGIEFINVDVGNEVEVQNGVDQVAEEHGGIDILINNAGIARPGKIHEVSLTDWNDQINTNLRGTFLMSRFVIPHMLLKGEGVIINMSSVNASGSTGNDAPYAATKAGIIAMTKSMAVDYSPTIRAVAIAPGSVDTQAQRDSVIHAYGSSLEGLEKGYNRRGEAHPMGRIAKTEEIASVVAFLATGEARFIDGSVVYVDGGLMAKNPASL